MKIEKLNLEDAHLFCVIVFSSFLFLFFRDLLTNFLLAAMVFQIYIRMLRFSFTYMQFFVALKAIASISRAIFSAFLLFLLVKYFSLALTEILLALASFILSFFFYGYLHNFRKSD